MERNELRVNNIVLRSVTGENYQQYQIAKGFDIDNVEHYKPIQITQEWLMKFGFERVNELCLFIDGGTLFVYHHGRLQFIHSNDSTIVEEIKYVHQLQNLFFALTGKELIIT